jgi:hypothetical protein
MFWWKFILQDRFSTLTRQISWKFIHLEPSSMRADRHNKSNGRFSQCCKEPKNVWRWSSLAWSCFNDTFDNLAQELLFGSWRLLSSHGNCGNKHMRMSCRKPVVLYEVRKVGQEFWSLQLLRTQRNVCSEKIIQALHYNTFRVCFNGFFFHVHFPFS